MQCFHRETAGYRFSRNPLPIPTGRKAKGSSIFLLRTPVPNGPPCEMGAGMRPNTRYGRFPSLPGGLFVKLPGSHAREVLPEHGTYMERSHQNETANTGNPVRAKTFCKPSRSRTRKYLSVLGTWKGENHTKRENDWKTARRACVARSRAPVFSRAAGSLSVDTARHTAGSRTAKPCQKCPLRLPEFLFRTR